jgi:hypothetical protein
MYKGGNMKLCFKCQTKKSLINFYKHSGMVDGYLNKCKSCAKEDTTNYRNQNIEKVRQYDRERSKLPHRIELQTRLTKLWRNQDKRRSVAHNAVLRALKNGKLIAQPCNICRKEEVVAHHDDYDKPLQVTWLCYSCHAKHHKGIV